MLVSKELGWSLSGLVLLSFAVMGQALAANVSPSMLKIERFNAERGDARSQYFMGEHYELGDSGLERDLEKALKWYHRSAGQGHAAAEYKIGWFHEQGYLGLSGGMGVAMEWYRKAAASGHDAARLRLEAVKRAEDEAAAARRQQLQDAQREQRRQAELQRQRERERSKMLRASKPAMAGLPLEPSPKKQPESPSYPPEKMVATLLATNWVAAGRPAEYLPASDMNCLKSADLEVTCFSQPRQRVLGDSKLVFSVKSEIGSFEPDGSFTARYFYNVSEISKAKRVGASSDPFGLVSKPGWQQPGHVAECRFDGQDGIDCGADTKAAFRFDAR
ncbi:MAG TPA: tetratricopeptide repeat protein [Gammaproteobacteria bacterium]